MDGRVLYLLRVSEPEREPDPCGKDRGHGDVVLLRQPGDPDRDGLRVEYLLLSLQSAGGRDRAGARVDGKDRRDLLCGRQIPDNGRKNMDMVEHRIVGMLE